VFNTRACEHNDFKEGKDSEYKTCAEFVMMYIPEIGIWTCTYHGQVGFRSNTYPKPRPQNVNAYNWSYCGGCDDHQQNGSGMIQMPVPGILNSNPRLQIDSPREKDTTGFDYLGFKCDSCDVSLCWFHRVICIKCPYARQLHKDPTKTEGIYCSFCSDTYFGRKYCFFCLHKAGSRRVTRT